MKDRACDERRLLERAQKDDAFRRLLRSNPRQAVEQELGVQIPHNVELHVHEETEDTFHLVLPPAGHLSEAQLEAVSGGSSYTSSCTCPKDCKTD
jgi:hypothetical protein